MTNAKSGAGGRRREISPPLVIRRVYAGFLQAVGTGRLSLGDPPLEMTGDARHDVAPAVAFLASRASQTLTGGSLRADGGVWTAG